MVRRAAGAAESLIHSSIARALGRVFQKPWQQLNNAISNGFRGLVIDDNREIRLRVKPFAFSQKFVQCGFRIGCLQQGAHRFVGLKPLQQLLLNHIQPDHNAAVQ